MRAARKRGGGSWGIALKSARSTTRRGSSRGNWRLKNRSRRRGSDLSIAVGSPGTNKPHDSVSTRPSGSSLFLVRTSYKKDSPGTSHCSPHFEQIAHTIKVVDDLLQLRGSRSFWIGLSPGLRHKTGIVAQIVGNQSTGVLGCSALHLCQSNCC